MSLALQRAVYKLQPEECSEKDFAEIRLQKFKVRILRPRATNADVVMPTANMEKLLQLEAWGAIFQRHSP